MQATIGYRARLRGSLVEWLDETDGGVQSPTLGAPHIQDLIIGAVDDFE